jgi:soluble lytic murein transglycosylase-like protein
VDEKTNVQRRYLWLWVLAAVLVGAALSLGASYAVQKWRLESNRQWREKIAVKSVGSQIPLSILDVIYAKGFEVTQVLALIETESDGNVRAVSKAGAVGLLQVMPGHADAAGYAVDDLYDAEINVEIGLGVLRSMAGDWANEYDLICAYNCGLSKWRDIRNAKKSPPSETRRQWRTYRRNKRRIEAWIERGEWWE